MKTGDELGQPPNSSLTQTPFLCSNKLMARLQLMCPKLTKVPEMTRAARFRLKRSLVDAFIA